MACVTTNADVVSLRWLLVRTPLFISQSEMRGLVRLAVDFINNTFLVFNYFHAEEGRTSVEGSAVLSVHLKPLGKEALGIAGFVESTFLCHGHLTFLSPAVFLDLLFDFP